MKTAMIRARVDPALKEEAESVLTKLGLGASEAISMYYAQIARRRALPFAVALDVAVGIGAPTPSITASTAHAVSDLPTLYKRLEELDEWRRFTHDARQMKLRA